MLIRIVVAGLLLSSCGRSTGLITGITPESRYIVEAISFRAHNETGIDATGSDEVVAVFDTATYRLITTTFGDVDAGETTNIPSGQNCIMPATDSGFADHKWSCIETGTQPPLAFTVALYEFDERILGFCGQLPFDIMPPNTTACNTDPDDVQLIGRAAVAFDKQQLVQFMPKAGDSYTGTISLFGGCDSTTSTSPCTAGGTFGPSPDYTLTYRITRVGNQIVEPPVAPNPN